MRLKPFGLYNEPAAFGLSRVNTVKDPDSHEFPDPFARGRFDAAKELVRKYSKDYAIVANLECLFFEIAWYLVGLDILNPIQPLAAGTDPKFLKDTYGDFLTFFGGIDIQKLLPFAQSETARSEKRG